ncbi:MAG: hypothetical protein OIF51_18215 [Cellvibrionaceae bacterium]|nr:hypothetical protein [Cellvibrionaceae bacterium]
MSDKKTDKPLAIAIHHCSDRQAKPLRYFFQSRTIGQYELSSSADSDLHKPDIHIVDIDSREGFDYAEELLETQPKLKVLCISFEKSAPGQALCIKKPVQKDALLQALSKVQLAEARSLADVQKVANQSNQAPEPEQKDTEEKKSRFHADLQESVVSKKTEVNKSSVAAAVSAEKPQPKFQKVGEAKNTAGAALRLRKSQSLPRQVNDDLGELEQARYQSENYLQGIVNTAIDRSRDEGQPVKVTIAKESFTICAVKRKIWHKIKYNTLRSISSSPILETNTELSALGQTNVDGVDYLIEEPLDDFLWRSSAWASRGRLLDDVSLNQNLRLTRWPNLTRVLLFPHASKIAAVLASRPISLLELIQDYKLPAYYVFSFYSAAASLGYITRYDGPKSNVETAKEERGIFLKLLDRLRPQSYKSEQI